MPKLISIATAVPDNKITQADAKAFASELFGAQMGDISRLLPLFDNTGITMRYFVSPPEWFKEDHSLEEKNRLYIEAATELGAQASRKLFEENGISPDQIDYIIYINSTGLATPTIDARLINVLGLKKNIRRTPIWGLGCAGGSAGLAHAYHYLIGHPHERVLVVAVELCGLTFIPDDFSKSNLVACALFGDGAAAALLFGDEVDQDGLSIMGTQSMFYPDSLNVMGWNIVSRGMQVVFDKKIPDIVLQYAAKDLKTFLDNHHLQQNDIEQYLYHPGGVKVLESYLKAFAVTDDYFKFSKNVLSNYGNMSSVTVLFVIQHYLKQHGINNPGYGIISSLGPGFCSESLLVKL